MAGLLALGAAACGDDVQVVEPTPPVPPPPPPVTASMAPASASVLIGNNVVFAVNASGGVAGDAASWTCASSNSGIASVSTVSAGCQATGVAAGSVTVTATVTKSGETVNVGAQLTVTEEATGDPAFIILAQVKDNTENDDTLSGRVTATINVERGDQELEEVALLVDGEVVASQSFGSSMDMGMAPPEDDAAEQAVHAFTLSFNTAGYAADGTPDYTNGEHTISATLEIGVTMADGMHGHETLSSNAITVEFGNDDAVHVSLSGLGDGALNSTTGKRWHGGPDFALKVAAIPVRYSGGAAASAVTLSQFCGGDAITDAEAPYEFSPKCGKAYVTPNAEKGDSLTFSIGGDDVSKVVGADKLFLDFDGPGAPTFKPNPNGREDGWINAAVGITSTSGKDSWLTKVGEDMNGVGGYLPRLRYAAKPSSGSSHAKAAVAAAASTSLPAEHKANDRYCVFASAVDRLGNESPLPKADDATCVEPGKKAVVASDGVEAADSTGYQALLDNVATTPTDTERTALANAGIEAGVDLTAPKIEFLSGAAKDKATNLGTETNETWGLHVSDKLGEADSDPLDVSIKVRDTKKTTTFKKQTAVGLDSFTVTSATSGETGFGFRHTVSILGGGNTGDEAARVRTGYYTFSATAKDKAGNKSAPASRVALHDPSAPPNPGLFLTPATGGGYNSIIVLTEDLSIRNYSTAVVLPAIGSLSAPELVAGTGTVDEYNAASLTTSKTIQGTVNLPYKALQNGADDTGNVDAINTFKAYVTNQAKTAASASVTAAVSTSGIAHVEFRENAAGNFAVTTIGDTDTGNETTVTFPATGTDSKNIKVKVVADMTDNATNVNAPFSAVGLYAEVQVGPEENRVSQLRQIAIIPSGKTALTGTGRTWTYEATLPLDEVWAKVKDDADISTATPNWTGRKIVAFGVAAKGLVVAEHSADITINKR